MLPFLILSIFLTSCITNGHDGVHGADPVTTNAPIELLWDFESSSETIANGTAQPQSKGATFEDNAPPPQLNSYGSLIFMGFVGAGCLFLIVMTACRSCDNCARRQQMKWEQKQAAHIAKERRLSTIRIQAQKNSIHSGSHAMHFSTGSDRYSTAYSTNITDITLEVVMDEPDAGANSAKEESPKTPSSTHSIEIEEVMDIADSMQTQRNQEQVR